MALTDAARARRRADVRPPVRAARRRDVEIVVHEDHPTLNRRVAELLSAGERIDVLSTHSKYAPSQAQWLRPLVTSIDVGALAPKAVDLCTFRGDLLSVPRCIDVRVLWSRTDRVATVPSTWDELAASDVVFGFPGRESGLFGTFFEIVVSQGGRLFDDDARPVIDVAGGRARRRGAVRARSRAPADLPDWHYDQVDAALLDGRVDAAAAWPGGYGPIRDSGVDQLAPHPYVGGISYAGVHSWAIPTTCADVDGGRGVDRQADELRRGAARRDAAATIPAHEEAFAAVEPNDDIDAQRLEITRDTIAERDDHLPATRAVPRGRGRRLAGDQRRAARRAVTAATRVQGDADAPRSASVG